MRSSAARLAGLVFGALLLNACAAAPRVDQNAPLADQTVLAPTLTIERFLRAANQNDLDTMAELFGTRDGSITRRDPAALVDRQMFLLASILRHSDYTIAGQQVVPGRREEATQYIVRMVVNDGTVNVPFTMVRSKDSGWLVEIIDLERITRPRSGG